jgi:hypothetical protein
MRSGGLAKHAPRSRLKSEGDEEPGFACAEAVIRVEQVVLDLFLCS